mmetsp:Transcript_5727/g.9793  ORF Transcript_5727/g.9793 Transcript_5727/m.9793 type:complete len:210 (-) Transcript_5727:431-1060(-)
MECCPPSIHSCCVSESSSKIMGCQPSPLIARNTAGTQNFKEAMMNVTQRTSKKRLQPVGPMRRLRHLLRSPFMWLKRAPSKPQRMPMRANTSISTMLYDTSVNLPKLTGTPVPNRVQGWLLMIGPRVSLVTRVATELETKSCVRILGVMWEAPSSTAKRTAPMGAPKAALTPAAAPAATKSRASTSKFSGRKRRSRLKNVAIAPTIAPL